MLQDQDTLTHALLAEQEWLATLSQKIAEVQSGMQQAQISITVPIQIASPSEQPAASSHSMRGQALAAGTQSESAESITSIRTGPEVLDYVSFGSEAPEQVVEPFALPVSAEDARVEAPARLQLTLGAELEDNDHHMVTEQQHRQASALH